MEQNQTLVTPSDQPPKNINPAVSPDGYSPMTIILSISVLIGAIAKLIQVLVPVMMKNRDSQ
ncbi:MAG: hypothetical protein QNJ38_14420 [Prochloraceae cyanobacterium]|nr:hypothetical protein [Prochloraceae cyanobacterium]